MEGDIHMNFNILLVEDNSSFRQTLADTLACLPNAGLDLAACPCLL
jgi:hypothetical protein